MAEQEQTPELLQLIDKWLDIVVDQLHNALDEYDIGKLDGDLWKSITGSIVSSGGSVQEVIVKFMQYGRFVDMGVGKGMPIGSQRKLGKKQYSKNRNGSGQLLSHNRKSKPWYSKTKYREIARLRELMADSLSDQAFSVIEGAIRTGINDTF